MGHEAGGAVIVRAAREAELPDAAELLSAGARVRGQRSDGEGAEPSLALRALCLRHDEDPRQIWLAERDGRVIGVATAAFRDRHAHIQRLVIGGEARDDATGGELLRALQAAARDAGCSVFTFHVTDDPGEMTHAFALGLAPQAPNVVWAATDPPFPRPGLDNPFELIPLTGEDDAALNTAGDIDKAVRGARRMRDLRRWLQEGERGQLLIDRATGRPAGYFLVARGAGGGRIGPVAAMDQSRFGAVLEIALAGAAELEEPGTHWSLVCPGGNRAASATLLAWRFRPTMMLAFFASGPVGQLDRYVFHDPNLL